MRWYWVGIMIMFTLCVSFFIPFDTMTLPVVSGVIIGLGIGFGMKHLESFVEGDKS